MMLLATVKEGSTPLECSFPRELSVYQHLPVQVWGCSNPVCDCQWLTLGMETKDLLLNPIRHELKVDLSDRSIQVDNEENYTTLCAMFEENIQQEDWDLLDNQYYFFKSRCMQDADLDTLEPAFSVFDVEVESTLIGYGEVLPFQFYPTFELGGDKYSALDMYCVNRACHCNTAHLIISPEIFDEDGDDLLLAVDLKTGRYEVEELGDPSLSFTASEAMDKVWSVVDIDTLRQRYTQMRQWYKAYFKKQVAELASIEKLLHPQPVHLEGQAGRNDPCPCGSGKKFKKCCMQVSAQKLLATPHGR